MRSLVLGLVLIFSIQSYGNSCISDIHVKVDESNENVNHMYGLTHDVGLRKGNGSRFLEGTRTDAAFIVVHGFLASPFEVTQISQMAFEEGFSVYQPLLIGFGGHPSHGNIYGRKAWRQSLQEAIEIMSECYSQIHLVGFSLGAALILEETVLNQNPKTASLTLISPAVKTPANSFLIRLTQATDIVSKDDLLPLHLAANKFYTLPDLEIPTSFPEYYYQSVPLYSAEELLKLQKEMEDYSPNGGKLKMPVYMLGSRADQSVSLDAAVEFVHRNFRHLNQFIFRKDLGIPHQVPFYLDRRNSERELSAREHLQSVFQSL